MPLGFSRATFTNDPAGSETIIQFGASSFGSSPGFAYSNSVNVTKDDLNIAQAPAQAITETGGTFVAANDTTNQTGILYQPLTQGTYRIQVQPFTQNFTNGVAVGGGDPASTMEVFVGIGGCGILNSGTSVPDHVVSASFKILGLLVVLLMC